MPLELKPESWLDIEQSERYKGYSSENKYLARSKFFSDVIRHDPEYREKYPALDDQISFEAKFVGVPPDWEQEPPTERLETNWLERGREAWRGQRYNMATDWMGGKATRTVLSSPGGQNPEARAEFWKARQDAEEQARTDPYAARNWFENLFHGVLGLVSGVEAVSEKGGLPGAIAGGLIGAQVGLVIPTIGEEPITVAAGAVLGYSIGTTAAWMEQGTGEAYGMLIEMDVDDPLAAITARVVGIPYGLIELAQMSRFLPKPVTKAIKQGILKTAMRVLARRGISAGVQIGQEGVQRGMIDAAVEGAKYLENEFAGKEHEFMGGKEMLKRIGREMKEAAGPMIVLGLPGGMVEMARSHPEMVEKVVAAGKAEAARVAKEEVGEARIGPGEEEAPEIEGARLAKEALARAERQQAELAKLPFLEQTKKLSKDQPPESGMRAEGQYQGVAFTGTIESRRFNTMNPDVVEIQVALDEPITVFGTERNNILVSAEMSSREGQHLRGAYGRGDSFIGYAAPDQIQAPPAEDFEAEERAAIREEQLEEAPAETEAEREALRAEYEEAGLIEDPEATPLLDALRSQRVWVSIEDLERVMGISRKDVPGILTGRHGIFVSPTETKGAAKGQLRTGLRRLDLLVEQATTPGGELWEVGGQRHGVDPDVDPASQFIEWLIEEGTKFVAPGKRVKKARPPSAERLLGIRRKKAEAAEYAALTRQQRKAARVAKQVYAAAEKVAREKAKVKAKEVRGKREEKRVDVWIAREEAKETARNKLLKERAEATLERERIRQTFREQRVEIAEIKKALVAYAQERLPKELRGRLLARVAKTKTRAALEKSITLIEKMHARAEATDARKSLVDTIKGLDLKHMRGEYRRKVEAIIEKLDPTKPTEATLTELESTRDYLQKNPDTWIPESEIEKLQRLEKTPISDMSTEDIRLIEMSITHAVKLEKLKGNLIATQRWRKLKDLGARVAETAARKGKGEFEGETALQGDLKVFAWPKLWWGKMERLETLCFMVDGDFDGALQDALYDTMDRAETERIQNRTADQEALKKKLAEGDVDLDVDFISWSETFPKKSEYVRVTLPSSGKEVIMTKGQRISFYLTSQDPDGLRSLLEGGRWTLERMGTSRWRLAPDPEALAALTMEDVDAVNDSMTTQEKAVAKVFSWFVNDYIKPLVNVVSNRIVGFDLLTEESYWMKTTDPTAIPVKPTDPALSMRRPYLHESVEAWGRFIPRKPGAKEPLVIQDAFKLIGEHIARTGSYRAYAGALRDAKAVLNMKEVQDALNTYMGRNMLSNLRTLIARCEDNSYKTGALDSFMARIHNNAVAAILIGKPVVWVRQALSYPCAYARVAGLEAKYLTRQLLKPIWSKKQKTLMLAWLKQHSPQIWYRLESGKMTRDVGDMMRANETTDLFMDYTTFREKIAFGLRTGDGWAIMRIVRAAQMQARAKLGAKAKQSEVDAYAAHLAEVAVRNTQPTWHVKDRSVIGGEPHWGWKAFTVFRSFREKLVQGQRMSWRIYLSERDKAADRLSKGEITKDQYQTALRKNKAGVVKDLTIFVIIATLLNNMTTEIWRRLRGKEPRYKLDKPATAVFGVLKDILASNLGHYYVIGDLLENIVKGWGEFKAFDPFRSPMIETGDRIVKFGAAVGNAAANAPIRPGADEKKFERAMSTIYRNGPVIVGRGTGYPIEGVVDIVEIAKEIIVPKKKKKKKGRRKRLKGF